MESYGNELVAFGLPSNQLVYEGSYRAVAPGSSESRRKRHSVDHYVLPKTNPDIVCSSVGKPQLRPYKLVYRTRDHVYLVYGWEYNGYAGPA